MDRKELERLMEEQAENMDIPVTLQPEFVMKELEEKAKKRKLAYYKKVVAAAACCTVVVGAVAAGAAGVFGGTGSGGGFGDGETRIAESASGKDSDSTAADDASGSAAAEVRSIASAKDYDEIFEYIEAENQAQNRRYEGRMYSEKASGTESVAYASDTGAGTSAGAGTAYSDTNIREEGVGEADVVKTDGERLYILNDRRIHIVDIGQTEMEELGEIDLGQDIYASELFVKGDRLIVVYTQGEYVESEEGDAAAYGGSYREYTVAETFDISNPKKPESVGKISQSGSYHTMRVVDGYAYILSNYYPDMDCARGDVGAYIPMVQGKSIDSSKIYVPSLKRGSQYTVITSFALDNPEEKNDSRAVFGGSGLCYVSANHIYICESDYSYEDTDVNRTWIRKLSYQEGELEAVGQAKLDGTLNDSFSIDEYEGNLRLVTTVSPQGESGIMPLMEDGVRTEIAVDSDVKETNVLYILDESLRELSRIDGLAPDETVYSARFMGETGYFVTFRQVDPLFSVDLSDPEDPQILGELKIPGFSEYLHPYGEGLLLGIGMDVDETGTTTNGVKLSMFDISDPEDVKEVQKYVLADTYSTDVGYNYKTALVDTEKNLIGFTAYGVEQTYYIFAYDKDGFRQLFARDLTGYSFVRAMYAGERLYLVSGNTVESYQMDTFDKIDDIVL